MNSKLNAFNTGNEAFFCWNNAFVKADLASQPEFRKAKPKTRILRRTEAGQAYPNARQYGSNTGKMGARCFS